ncbi:MAG TPA: hypothetical protein VF546_24080 [Pyrinomonadaceae bacterium]|jgi:hypothetical protein
MAQPGLGPNDAVCTQAFIDAMRVPILADLAQAQLEGDEEKIKSLTKALANLDKDEVKKNIRPFGQAVFDIATTKARVTSAAADDAAFWQWIAAVGAWLTALATWQQGVAQAFSAWNAVTAPEKELQQKVADVPAPPAAPPPAPASLAGRLE